ncbi:glutamine--tRNA ligase/YqeY domain fusion protein [Taylorella equigenitalis]|uniref:glutamine--tRNA ligase/YqeY domain fusion protein n=1 Tax=Taylorella equigenitalis TaxID=29575 RepID=UPI00237D7C10|nr:glutamine--tRNA ligase/YqeY domain fusion protein [Taylorella equigenitalis]WDU51603.1 glutamine--tRNA ligase/YqeY domain fusion protein [Taylorella equigenitalis]
MSIQEEALAPNFLKNLIESNLKDNLYKDKRWAGKPGPASIQKEAPLDQAKIRTRFPPEPNGYLHLGHAKSIIINFGLAEEYGGVCHLRFDDTNPEKEDTEYVEAIKDSVKWLGYDWEKDGESNLYYASDYFDYFYDFATALIKNGDAYIDEQTPEEMRINRGTLTEAGKDSPWRNRPIEESLDLFTRMKDGEFPDGSYALRAKVDMASPNINMRDPVIYRIKHAHHHRTGDKWCIYPMYTFAHPIEDALEGITHSFCTLEFEDQRPFYEWLLDKLESLGLLRHPLPKQTEFSRLNVQHIVTSKRKLLNLVEKGIVDGWDDPRMPTIAGLRRRGYTPNSIHLFIKRLGVSKSDSFIDYKLLEQALRDDLDPIAPRAVAVLDPIKLVINNVPEDFEEHCHAPINPHAPEAGNREFMLTKELWIEREDFMEEPPKKYFRLFVGNKVRLKYGYIVECTGFLKDSGGNVSEVYVDLIPDTKSGTSGSSSIKVKGNITWVSTKYALPAQINLYDRLFTEASPDSGGKDYMDYINPNSLKVVNGWLEPGIDTNPGNIWQFERLGYFIADPSSTSEKGIINRSVTLKDSWVG